MSMYEPLTRSGVVAVLRDPASLAEGNLAETVRLLSLALLQASDAEGCPCCGEDPDQPHIAGCVWPELVRLGYVDAAQPVAVEPPPAPVAPAQTGADPRCCCAACPVTDCSEHLLATPDPRDLLPAPTPAEGGAQ